MLFANFFSFIIFFILYLCYDAYGKSNDIEQPKCLWLFTNGDHEVHWYKGDTHSFKLAASHLRVLPNGKLKTEDSRRNKEFQYLSLKGKNQKLRKRIKKRRKHLSRKTFKKNFQKYNYRKSRLANIFDDKNLKKYVKTFINQKLRSVSRSRTRTKNKKSKKFKKYVNKAFLKSVDIKSIMENDTESESISNKDQVSFNEFLELCMENNENVKNNYRKIIARPRTEIKVYQLRTHQKKCLQQLLSPNQNLRRAIKKQKNIFRKTWLCKGVKKNIIVCKLKKNRHYKSIAKTKFFEKEEDPDSNEMKDNKDDETHGIEDITRNTLKRKKKHNLNEVAIENRLKRIWLLGNKLNDEIIVKGTPFKRISNATITSSPKNVPEASTNDDTLRSSRSLLNFPSYPHLLRRNSYNKNNTQHFPIKCNPKKTRKKMKDTWYLRDDDDMDTTSLSVPFQQLIRRNSKNTVSNKSSSIGEKRKLKEIESIFYDNQPKHRRLVHSSRNRLWGNKHYGPIKYKGNLNNPANKLKRILYANWLKKKAKARLIENSYKYNWIKHMRHRKSAFNNNNKNNKKLKPLRLTWFSKEKQEKPPAVTRRKLGPLLENYNDGEFPPTMRISLGGPAGSENSTNKEKKPKTTSSMIGKTPFVARNLFRIKKSEVPPSKNNATSNIRITDRMRTTWLLVKNKQDKPSVIVRNSFEINNKPPGTKPSPEKDPNIIKSKNLTEDSKLEPLDKYKPIWFRKDENSSLAINQRNTTISNNLTDLLKSKPLPWNPIWISSKKESPITVRNLPQEQSNAQNKSGPRSMDRKRPAWWFLTNNRKQKSVIVRNLLSMEKLKKNSTNKSKVIPSDRNKMYWFRKGNGNDATRSGNKWKTSRFSKRNNKDKFSVATRNLLSAEDLNNFENTTSTDQMARTRKKVVVPKNIAKKKKPTWFRRLKKDAVRNLSSEEYSNTVGNKSILQSIDRKKPSWRILRNTGKDNSAIFRNLLSVEEPNLTNLRKKARGRRRPKKSKKPTWSRKATENSPVTVANLFLTQPNIVKNNLTGNTNLEPIVRKKGTWFVEDNSTDFKSLPAISRRSNSKDKSKNNSPVLTRGLVQEPNKNLTEELKFDPSKRKKIYWFVNEDKNKTATLKTIKRNNSKIKHRKFLTKQSKTEPADRKKITWFMKNKGKNKTPVIARNLFPIRRKRSIYKSKLQRIRRKNEENGRKFITKKSKVEPADRKKITWFINKKRNIKSPNITRKLFEVPVVSKRKRISWFANTRNKNVSPFAFSGRKFLSKKSKTEPVERKKVTWFMKKTGKNKSPVLVRNLFEVPTIPKRESVIDKSKLGPFERLKVTWFVKDNGTHELHYPLVNPLPVKPHKISREKHLNVTDKGKNPPNLNRKSEISQKSHLKKIRHTWFLKEKSKTPGRYASVLHVLSGKPRGHLLKKRINVKEKSTKARLHSTWFLHGNGKNKKYKSEILRNRLEKNKKIRPTSFGKEKAKGRFGFPHVRSRGISGKKRRKPKKRYQHSRWSLKNNRKKHPHRKFKNYHLKNSSQESPLKKIKHHLLAKQAKGTSGNPNQRVLSEKVPGNSTENTNAISIPKEHYSTWFGKENGKDKNSLFLNRQRLGEYLTHISEELHLSRTRPTWIVKNIGTNKTSPYITRKESSDKLKRKINGTENLTNTSPKIQHQRIRPTWFAKDNGKNKTSPYMTRKKLSDTSNEREYLTDTSEEKRLRRIRPTWFAKDNGKNKTSPYMTRKKLSDTSNEREYLTNTSEEKRLRRIRPTWFAKDNGKNKTSPYMTRKKLSDTSNEREYLTDTSEEKRLRRIRPTWFAKENRKNRTSPYMTRKNSFEEQKKTRKKSEVIKQKKVNPIERLYKTWLLHGNNNLNSDGRKRITDVWLRSGWMNLPKREETLYGHRKTGAWISLNPPSNRMIGFDNDNQEELKSAGRNVTKNNKETLEKRSRLKKLKTTFKENKKFNAKSYIRATWLRDRLRHQKT